MVLKQNNITEQQKYLPMGKFIHLIFQCVFLFKKKNFFSENTQFSFQMSKAIHQNENLTLNEVKTMKKHFKYCLKDAEKIHHEFSILSELQKYEGFPKLLNSVPQNIFADTVKVSKKRTPFQSAANRPSERHDIEKKQKYGFFIEKLDYSLFDLLSKRNCQLRDSTTKSISLKLLKRLFTIHKLHIVHQDLKPENIMFKSQNGLKLYLIDFDLSVKKEDFGFQKSTKNSMKGNLKYSSRSQMEGNTVGYLDDLESFVYMFHELAGGVLPWVVSQSWVSIWQEKSNFYKFVEEQIKKSLNVSGKRHCDSQKKTLKMLKILQNYSEQEQAERFTPEIYSAMSKIISSA